MCRYPIYNKAAGVDVPCGQCMHCRVNKQRVWAMRIVLESLAHESSLFVTLTYNDQHLVFNNKDAVLYYPDVQAFLKRLRERDVPRFRFYCVGEYGERTQRPHYHLAMFGLSMDHCRHIDAAWSDDLGPIGHVNYGSLTWDSAAYIAGYVTKKMTCVDDPRLYGRSPEFAKMSLRPGIGASYVEKMSEILGPHIVQYIASTGDVPTTLNMGSKTLPLGRYMISKLRKQFNVEVIGDAKKKAYKTKMRIVREAESCPSSPLNKPLRLEKLARFQKMTNREARAAIFKKEKKL